MNKSGKGDRPVASDQRVLGGPPLCEASAAVRAPWDDHLVLVADNEVEGELFTFRLEGGFLEPAGRLALPSNGPRDIEALEADGERVFVVGSHGRSSKGKVKRRRRRLLIARRDPETGNLVAERLVDGDKALRAAADGEAACRTALFEGDPEFAEIVARAIAEGEAGGAWMNIEGALALGEPGTAEPWLGLRSPLTADGAAILLRLAPGTTTLRADAACLVELGGLGVREVLRHGEQVLGIAGPTADLPGPFRLWRARAAEIVPGARVMPRWLGELPESSEALVADGAHVIVLVDGERGPDDRNCARPARQVRIPLTK